MKKHLTNPRGSHRKESGTQLYRAIDGIDEKWIALADDPSVTLAQTAPSRSPVKRISKRLTAVCAILLLLLISAELISAVTVYSAPLSPSERFALEYTECYGGSMTSEKYETLLAYREEVTHFLAQHDKVTAAARSGQIAFSEYRAYMERYHDLEPRALSLDRFVAYTTYLQDTGAEVQILYRSMWERFFERDRLPLLVAALFVSACLVTVLSRRYDLSKRKRTASAFALGAAVSLIFCVTELLIFCVLCRPDGLGASIVSLERFSAFPPALTLGGYLALRSLLTALLSSAVASLFTSLLCRLPRSLPTPKMIRTMKGEST